MNVSSAIPGTSPDMAGAVTRPPGAPSLEPRPAVAEPAPRVQTPPPPRVDYDPVKLRENLRSAIDHLNKQMASHGRSLGFTFDEVLRAPVVTVRSTETGEVIRQIPSEAVVRVAHTLDALKGLLHDAVT
jgi:flagellar protein FlaG